MSLFKNTSDSAGNGKADNDMTEVPMSMTVEELNRQFTQASGGEVRQPDPGTEVTIAKESTSSDNKLRPADLADFQGQDRAKRKIEKYMHAAKINDEPMLHVLLTAKAGQGKTTLASIIGNTLGVDVFWEGAPIHRERLLELSQEMQDGDVLMIDEIHLQAKGGNASTSPEMLYHVMEDFKIVTLNQGLIDFPRVTVIGATTDEGLLKPSFKERFPIKILFEDYTDDELAMIAALNAKQLDTGLADEAAMIFASASLGIPREVNNFMHQASVIARALHADQIDTDLAMEVLDDDGRATDGLKRDMVKYLNCLWERRRWSEPKEDWTVKASLATMAHAVGRARDKATIEHDIEPILITRGYIDIVPGGRILTPKGMRRLGVSFEDPLT